MTDAQFRKAVARFDGWIEADKARFPTPHKLAQFIAYVESFKAP